MKVVHILNTNSYSGAENVVIQIIKNFKKDKELKCVYMSVDGPIKNVLEKNNIEFYLVEKINRKSIKKMMRELNPDILHCHDYTTSILASSISQIKIISHLHNNSPWIKRFGFYSWIFLLSSIRYSEILLVSESIKKEYVFSKLIYRKMQVIGNPIDSVNIVEKSREIQVSKNYDICFLGRLSPQKNPILFIEIVEVLKQKYPEIKVCIIGDGELREEVTKLIEQKDLKKTVDLLGYMTNPYPYLKNSKFLLATSRWEGYGLFAVEALVLEKPVVCTKVGGLVDIVNDECGIVCANKAELIKACSLLLCNDELYEKKQQGTKVRVKELTNKNEYMRLIMDLYKHTEKNLNLISRK